MPVYRAGSQGLMVMQTGCKKIFTGKMAFNKALMEVRMPDT